MSDPAAVRQARLGRLGPGQLAQWRASRLARIADLEARSDEHSPPVSIEMASQRSELDAIEAELDRRGRCRECGRSLARHESVAAGIGPNCGRKVGR